MPRSQCRRALDRSRLRSTLLAWAQEEFRALLRAGVEGSSSFGVGLVRFLRARGVEVVEANRPNRQQLDRMVAEAAPALIAIGGIGTDSAATLLTAAGGNPERLRSEAAFANLCGVASIPASSGKKVRYRLNRDGNRDANRALQTVAVVRMRWDERTRAYVERRSAEGKSKPEIIRCLKRYICREVYRVLIASREGHGGPSSLPDGAPRHRTRSSAERAIALGHEGRTTASESLTSIGASVRTLS